MEGGWKGVVRTTYPQIDFDAVLRPWDYVARMAAGVADSAMALVGGVEPHVHAARCLGHHPVDSYEDGLAPDAGPVAAVSAHTGETLVTSEIGIVCDVVPLTILEGDAPTLGIEDHGDAWTLLDALWASAAIATDLSLLVLGPDRRLDFDLVGGSQGIMLALERDGRAYRTVAAPDWQHELGII